MNIWKEEDNGFYMENIENYISQIHTQTASKTLDIWGKEDYHGLPTKTLSVSSAIYIWEEEKIFMLFLPKHWQYLQQDRQTDSQM